MFIVDDEECEPIRIRSIVGSLLTMSQSHIHPSEPTLGIVLRGLAGPVCSVGLARVYAPRFL